MSNWNNILIKPSTSILQAIEIIDKEGLRAALVIDEGMHLLGVITDGDIRRSILRNISLDSPIETIMNKSPMVAFADETREKMLVKLQTHKLFHMPIVDEARQVIGFETLENLLSAKKENVVVVMAGGLGKRLHPLTVDCPKPLLKVGNKPVLEILLNHFAKNGFHHFYFAVNYKADMIKSYFGSGEQWGVDIRYVEEQKRMGTAGALALLPELPKESLFVINADVVTTIDFQSLLEYHQESKADATLCIREHAQMIPYGVVERDEHTHQLLHIVEKPTRQFFVNAGIYVLEPTILSLLTPNMFCDMPDLLSTAVAANYKVVTFPIREYWLDIGRHEDLEQAHLDYEKAF